MMINKYLATILVFLTANVSFFSTFSHAGQTNSARPATPQQAYPATGNLRDPFTPSTTMFDAMSFGSASNQNGYGFMRSPANSDLPKMRLRGFIEKEGDDPIALLEVANARTFLVKVGDEINIDPSVPNSAIRVTKISRFSITVEAGMLGSIRVQR